MWKIEYKLQSYYKNEKKLKSNQFQLLILLIFINGKLPKDEIDLILKFEGLKWYITSWVSDEIELYTIIKWSNS